MPDFVKEGVVSEEEMDAHYARDARKDRKTRNAQHAAPRRGQTRGHSRHQRRGGRHRGARLGVDAACACTPAGARRHGYKVKVARLPGRRRSRGEILRRWSSRGSTPTATSRARTACTAWCACRRSTPTTSVRPRFASVFVSPAVDDTIEITVNAADIEWDTFRSSGAGAAERQQGGDGRAPALPRERPRHGRGDRVPDREHGDALAADEPRERHAHPPLETLPARAGQAYGDAAGTGGFEEEDRVGFADPLVRLRRPPREGSPHRACRLRPWSR